MKIEPIIGVRKVNWLISAACRRKQLTRTLGIGLFALLAVGCGQRTATPAATVEQDESVVEPDTAPPSVADRADAAPEKAPPTEVEFDPLAPMGEPWTEEERAESLRCQKRADCTLVAGVCGGWDPVNAANAEKLSRLNQQMAARARCAPSKTPPSSPDCRDGQCRVIEHEWPELRACEAPTDCVAIEGVCSGWNVVAKAHRAEAARRIAQIATIVRCKAPESPIPRPTPVCRDRFCVPY